jgi:sulfite exporter TauE/SafE
LLAAGSFTIGAVGTAALFGAVLGFAGSQLFTQVPYVRTLLLISVAAASGVYGLAALVGVELQVPTGHWMVPRHWGGYGWNGGALLFGSALGLGLLTVIPFVGYYLVLAFCFLSHRTSIGAVTLGAFGLGRSLPILATAVSAAVINRSVEGLSPRAAPSKLAVLHSIAMICRPVLLLTVSISALMQWI